MNPSPSPVGLTLEDLSIRYPSAMENAIERISLRLAGGEIVALAGPNGCGKTTLLRAAAGMLSPAAGRVWISDAFHPLHRLSPEQRARWIGVVPQMEKLPAGYTVAETVMLGRISFHGWFGPERDADRRAVRSALAAVGLEGMEQSLVGTLSGGGQQRVLIARALAQEAPILLMDEPTAHLDIRFQLETLGLLRALARTSRRAVMIAIHDLNLASRFADRVALLDRGRLIHCGSPAEVLTSEILSRLFATPLQVIPHPHHGFPLILPDGEEPPAADPSKNPVPGTAGPTAPENSLLPGNRHSDEVADTAQLGDSSTRISRMERISRKEQFSK
jgi:iron complex transport system ATP-binding protein